METFFSDLKMEEITYRWLEKRDVEKIDFLQDTKDIIKKQLSLLNTFGFVVEKDQSTPGFRKEKKIIAYFLFKSLKNRIKIIDIFVREESRKSGIGAGIINYISEKQKDKDLELMAPEENLPLHLFLKNQGFKATEIKTEKNNEVYYKFFKKC
jgi:GNAT superfamily N-acetyltransferase